MKTYEWYGNAKNNMIICIECEPRLLNTMKYGHSVDHVEKVRK